MNRLLIVAVSVVLAVVSGVGTAPPASAASHSPRVVIIVGPVGKLTDAYRELGRSAASEAARWTSDVVTVASPNATWPAVKRALQGASFVVYLGHGNGFPSPYGTEPSRQTQNGLGLNPVAGVDDSAHQYFGEAFLARDVRLAPGAIVVLSRLCYASGNPEPGGPEPTVEVAAQRADNFAAGWLAAGAQAVVADAFEAPGAYVRRMFATGDSITRLWRTAGTHHDNVVSIPSDRSVGATLLLDPTTPVSGFYRSLTVQPGPQAGATFHPAAAGGTAHPQVVPVTPSLVTLGVRAGVATLAPSEAGRSLVAGKQASLTLSMKLPKGAALPSGLRLAVRWQSLDPSTSPPASAAVADGSASPAAPDTQPSEPPTTEPPAIVLVAAEQPATVVSSATAVPADGGLRVTVSLPVEPGRYRLTTTILDAGDVAFDAPTQALVAALVVQVSRPVSIAYGLVGSVAVESGATFALPVRLANNGSLPWAEPPMAFDGASGLGHYNPAPIISVRWLPLVAPSGEVTSSEADGPRLDPGEETVVALALTAPQAVGSYMLVIDVISPVHGSLAAAGGSFAETRVTVAAPLVTSTGTGAN